MEPITYAVMPPSALMQGKTATKVELAEVVSRTLVSRGHGGGLDMAGLRAESLREAGGKSLEIYCTASRGYTVSET